MAERGRFITFEGGEGCGKSTQLKLLFDALSQRGLSLVLTNEPGGTDEGKRLRADLLTGAKDRWDATEELLLFSVDRHLHVRKKLEPALASGQWVVSDRYYDSTTAYQGYGRGYPLDKIEMIRQVATDGLKPDLTLVFDLHPSIAVPRSLARRGNTEVRFENLDPSFHERVHQGFLTIAKAEPERCRVIDASGTIPEVQARVWQAVSQKFGLT